MRGFVLNLIWILDKCKYSISFNQQNTITIFREYCMSAFYVSTSCLCISKISSHFDNVYKIFLFLKIYKILSSLFNLLLINKCSTHLENFCHPNSVIVYWLINAVWKLVLSRCNNTPFTLTKLGRLISNCSWSLSNCCTRSSVLSVILACSIAW